MKTSEVRRRFLDFFERNGHTVVPSASLVYDDPTLLFVNAGMVQFKPYFTGQQTPPYPRATSVQKCVRTLDIEEVGKTTRHGTFFQMNGNFSFGDYFKEGAINFALGLVAGPQSEGGYGFDADKLWVTVYHDDNEGAALWEKAGIPKERIQRRGLKDNYWNMGVPGPGGPCSEIYVDRGPEFGPDGGPEVDEDRFLEIWNLVFMQEELGAVRAKDDFDVLRPLPKKNIDTGMGLERVAYLLQGVDNLYEIDEVFPVLAKAAELAGKKYAHSHGPDDVRLRVVADHVRSALMLMTDGVTPGNEARGYVLRRLLRRSVRAMWLLGVQDPVLPELLPVARDLMALSYSEVAEQWERVSQLAYGEEESFRRTLQSGSRIFDLAAKATKASGSQTIPGDKAFELHDTFGFPIDITLEMAQEAGLGVDRDEFAKLMAEQRARARADAKSKKGSQLAVEAYADLRNAGEIPFLGYTQLEAETKVRGLVRDGAVVASAGPGEIVEVVLDATPFYAEAGGQDADTGLITGSGLALEVVDVQKPVQGLTVHKVRVADGEVAPGMPVLASVDAAARAGSCQAHTATHIVNAALRQIIGPSTAQQGSYNKPGYLRFDFNAAQALSKGMQEELEGVSNAAIWADYEVTDRELPLAEAKALGAQAMFGEKYGAIVRMVELNGPWSRELCGGTHVKSTAEIGLLSLVGESSVGSGTRRVEAFVSGDAFSHLAAERALVANLADILKTQPDQLRDRVEKLVAQLKAAERELAAFKAAQLADSAPKLLDGAEAVGAYRLVSARLDGVAGEDLRSLAVDLRQRLGGEPGVVALVGGAGKPALVVATTQAARDAGAKAGALVSVGAAALGGRGGGRDDLAQGGGADPAAAPAALDAIRRALAS
ncbi:MAG: alanine--tRNA ligase [Propionibacteriaceae bacterium]|jgi:alanyl-tRNA synthetase|nr:alanine--tRNA ligase [Propionibacteriaceae bacterium]